VDEKTAIQAPDRKDPVLSLSPRRAERHGFEYFRHGTLSLYAAFDTETAEVLGKTAVRHTSAEFLAFLADIVVNQPRPTTSRPRKARQVEDLLDRHPEVHLHFTPIYFSWLNRSDSGVPRLSATLLRAARSRRWPTCEARTCKNGKVELLRSYAAHLRPVQLSQPTSV
jgi:hypothetical protein